MNSYIKMYFVCGSSILLAIDSLLHGCFSKKISSEMKIRKKKNWDKRTKKRKIEASNWKKYCIVDFKEVVILL